MIPTAIRVARSFLIVPTLLALGCGGGATVRPADLVILDGDIVTLDEDRARVQALAVRGGRIVALGSSDEMRSWVGDETEVLSLEGAFAAPGFIEGHGHFLSLGRSLAQLDLTDETSWADIVDRVRTVAEGAAPEAWILGRGWHQSKWA